MNCRRFQNQVFDYLDETLSPGEREAADGHLGQCAACRDVLQRERTAAQKLSERFQKEMSGVSLRAGAQGRILAALADHSHKERHSLADLIVRLAWGGGLAACVLLVIWLMGGFSSKPPHTVSRASQGQGQAKGSVPVSIDISYAVPTHVSRQEGNQMVDTLIQEPRTTSQTIYWVKD